MKYFLSNPLILINFLFFSSKNREFVSRLRDANKTVYLITGGFDCLIEPVANELGIPLDHMFANRLYFSFNGKLIFPISISLNLYFHSFSHTIHHNFIASKINFNKKTIFFPEFYSLFR